MDWMIAKSLLSEMVLVANGGVGFSVSLMALCHVCWFFAVRAGQNGVSC